MTPFSLLWLAAALIFAVVFIQLGALSVAFDKLGLSRDSAVLLLAVTLLGSLINVPLFSVRSAKPADEAAPRQLREILGLPRLRFTGRTIVAVNVGGAVTPVAFSAYLLAHHPLDAPVVAAAIATVSLVSYLTSRPLSGIGIGMPFLVAPVTAALAAIVLDPEHAAPLAYIGGTLGVLIGADLLRIRQIGTLGAPVASIGGAGTFDGIFLTGLLAVLLA